MGGRLRYLLHPESRESKTYHMQQLSIKGQHVLSSGRAAAWDRLAMINSGDEENGASPLHLAAAVSHKEMVSSLKRTIVQYPTVEPTFDTSVSIWFRPPRTHSPVRISRGEYVQTHSRYMTVGNTARKAVSRVFLSFGRENFDSKEVLFWFTTLPIGNTAHVSMARWLRARVTLRLLSFVSFL